MPKFGNRTNKGYAFIEFQIPLQAKAAIEHFDNCVP